MSKFLRFIGVLLLVLVLACLPVGMAPAVLADDDQPIQIKSAVVETEDNRVVSEVKICNSEHERVRFVLDVKNLTINHIYKRKMSVAANDCITTDLHFTKDFAEMSNVGDQIVFTAKRVRGLYSHEKYDFSDKYTTTVVKGQRDYAGCSDLKGDDDIYNACEMDFVYHEPSGLRIKVLESNSNYVQLKLTHIEWGGTKEMRIYKGRSKKIRSNYEELQRVELTNVYGENTSDLFLKVESLS